MQINFEGASYEKQFKVFYEKLWENCKKLNKNSEEMARKFGNTLRKFLMHFDENPKNFEEINRKF